MMAEVPDTGTAPVEQGDLLASLEDAAAGIDMSGAPPIKVEVGPQLLQQEQPAAAMPEPVPEPEPEPEPVEVAGVVSDTIKGGVKTLGKFLNRRRDALRAAEEAAGTEGKAVEGAGKTPTEPEGLDPEQKKAFTTIGNVRDALEAKRGEPPIREDIATQIENLSVGGATAEQIFDGLDMEAINSIDDFPVIMEGIVKALRGADVDKRAVQTIPTRDALARKLRMTPQRLINQKTGTAYNAEQLGAIDLMVRREIARLRTMHGVTFQNPTPENYVRLRRQTNLMSALVLNYRDARGEAGRALNSLKYSTKAVSPLSKRAETQDLFLQIGGMKTNESFVDALGKMLDHGTDDQILAFAESSRRVNGMDMLFEGYVNTFLGSFATDAINISSNTVLQVDFAMERWLAATYAGLERTAIKAVGSTPTPGGVTFEEASAHTTGSIMAIMALFRDLWRAGISPKKIGEVLSAGGGIPIGGMTKAELGPTPAITSANINQLPLAQAMSPELLRQGGSMAAVVDGVAAYYYRGPGALLITEDMLFKKIAYEGELYAQAIREANKRGLRDNKETEATDRSDFINDVLADPEMNFPDTHVAAVDFAKRATLTQPLGKIGESLSDFRNALRIGNLPVGRVIVPFFNVISNITKTGLERVPGLLEPAPGVARFFGPTSQFAPGADPAVRQLTLARWTAGSAIMAAFSALAAQGLITGRMTDDPKLGKFLEGSGRMKYSIFIPWTRICPTCNRPDTFYELKKLQPIPGQFLALMADTSRALAHTKDRDERDSLALAAVAAVVPYMEDQSFMVGLTSLLEAVNPQNAWGTSAIRQLERYLGNVGMTLPGAVVGPFTPGGPLAGSVARQVDPVKRNTRPNPNQSSEYRIWETMVNKIFARTPYLSALLEPLLDAEAKVRTQDPRWGIDMLSPFAMRELKWSTKKLKDAGLPERVWKYTNVVGMRVGRREGGRIVGGEIDRAQHKKFMEIVGWRGELERLGHPINNVPNIIEGVELSVQQQNEYQMLAVGNVVSRRVEQINPKTGKKALYNERWSIHSSFGSLFKRIENLMFNKGPFQGGKYQDLSDDPEVNNAKHDRIKKIVNDYRERARRVFLTMHPEIAKIIADREAGLNLQEDSAKIDQR
jgi:hypothetical protein